jgi:hypothetical protein
MKWWNKKNRIQIKVGWSDWNQEVVRWDWFDECFLNLSKFDYNHFYIP